MSLGCWFCLLKKFLLGFLCSKVFIVNAVLSVALVEFSLLKLKKLQTKTEEDPKLSQKYRAFEMNKIDHYNRLPLYLCAPFTLMRFLLGWGGAVANGIFLTILIAIRDQSKPFSPLEQWLIDWSTWATAKLVLAMANCY
jgi:hypothetical protein